MQLGKFIKDQKTGVYTGEIRTSDGIFTDIQVVPIAKRGEAGPDARIYSATGSDFGAAWQKLRERDGKPYLSCNIHDLNFNGGRRLVGAILIESDETPGVFVMAYEPADPTKAATRPAATPAESIDQTVAVPAPGRKPKA
jgi:uncharacterized protein (DUF736 family)